MEIRSTRRVHRISLAAGSPRSHIRSNDADREEGDDEEYASDIEDETPDLEREAARLLLGRRIVRRRRGRRALLARYLREVDATD